MFTQPQQSLQTHNEQQRRSNSDSDGEKAQREGQNILYRGARMRKWGRWVSEIRVPHKGGRIWLGSYESACKAALAYDFASFCLLGRRAKLNFPECLPYLSPESGIPTSPRSIQAAANQFAEQHGSRYCLRSEPATAAAVAVESQEVLAAVAVGSQEMLVGGASAKLSERISISSSSSYSYDGNGQQLLLPVLDLDFSVLDSLSEFLAANSHTDWWLG